MNGEGERGAEREGKRGQGERTSAEWKHGDGNGDVVGMRIGVETRGRTQDETRHGSEDGNKSTSGNSSGDGDRNGDGIREGGEETKKSKRSPKRCRRDVGNRGDLGG